MMKFAVCIAVSVVICAAQDASFKASGDNLRVFAEGTIRMKAGTGTEFSISPTDITMIPGGNVTKTKTFQQLAAELQGLTDMNTMLSKKLSDLKNNYTNTTTEVATMKSAYAIINQNYTATLNAMSSEFTKFKAETTQVVQASFDTAQTQFAASTTGTNNQVGNLLKRYNDLVASRAAGVSDAVAAVNDDVADAQAVKDSSSSDVQQLATAGSTAAAQLKSQLDAADKVLTDAMEDANSALSTGNTAIATSVTNINDLVTAVNTRLSATVAAQVQSNTNTLQTSVNKLLDELEDGYLTLEGSIQKLRTYINSDFDMYTESSLAPEELNAGDEFGRVSASAGNTIAIGAPFFKDMPDEDGNPVDTTVDYGAVFIYEYDPETLNFTRKQVILGENDSDLFGADVAMEGDWLVTGASWWDVYNEAGEEIGTSTGKVYIYRKDAEDGMYKLKQELYAPKLQTLSNFGRTVSISGNRLLVGAPFHDLSLPGNVTILDHGLLYVFERADEDSDFVFSTSLVAPAASASDLFGIVPYSMRIMGDYILAGSVYDETDSTKTDHGRAFIWQYKPDPVSGRFSWMLDYTFEAPIIDAQDYFGYAAHMCMQDGNLIVGIGAHGDDNNDPGSTVSSFTGATYIWSKSRTAIWSQPQTIRDPELQASAAFGVDLDFDNDCRRLAVTGYGTSQAGKVWFYDVNGGSATYTGSIVPKNAAAQDLTGFGITWGDGFVGFGGFRNDLRGANAGMYHAVSIVDAV